MLIPPSLSPTSIPPHADSAFNLKPPSTYPVAFIRSLSMASVERYFSGQAMYPFVILTDDVEAVRIVQAWTTHRVIFQRVEFRYRAGFNASLAPDVFKIPEWPSHPGWNMNYRHMSRYAAWDLFQEPVFDHFDYVVKLDTDAIFTDAFDGGRDPVDELHQRRMRFAFWFQYQDVSYVTRGLEAAIHEFLAVEKILPLTPRVIFAADEKSSYMNTNFYGCFWIAQLSFFRSGDYKRLFNHFDAKDGFYLYRWDEQKLYAIAAALFMRQSDILFMDNAHLRHQAVSAPSKCCGI